MFLNFCVVSIRKCNGTFSIEKYVLAIPWGLSATALRALNYCELVGWLFFISHIGVLYFYLVGYMSHLFTWD